MFLKVTYYQINPAVPIEVGCISAPCANSRQILPVFYIKTFFRSEVNKPFMAELEEIKSEFERRQSKRELIINNRMKEIMSEVDEALSWW